jgi:hypothetical protein
LQTDLARSLRRIQPERFRGSLPRRDDAELDFADAAPLIGPPLLLDTCVYVDALDRLGRHPNRAIGSRRHDQRLECLI